MRSKNKEYSIILPNNDVCPAGKTKLESKLFEIIQAEYNISDSEKNYFYFVKEKNNFTYKLLFIPPSAESIQNFNTKKFVIYELIRYGIKSSVSVEGDLLESAKVIYELLINDDPNSRETIRSRLSTILDSPGQLDNLLTDILNDVQFNSFKFTILNKDKESCLLCVNLIGIQTRSLKSPYYTDMEMEWCNISRVKKRRRKLIFVKTDGEIFEVTCVSIKTVEAGYKYIQQCHLFYNDNVESALAIQEANVGLFARISNRIRKSFARRSNGQQQQKQQQQQQQHQQHNEPQHHQQKGDNQQHRQGGKDGGKVKGKGDSADKDLEDDDIGTNASATGDLSPSSSTHHRGSHGSGSHGSHGSSSKLKNKSIGGGGGGGAGTELSSIADDPSVCAVSISAGSCFVDPSVKTNSTYDVSLGDSQLSLKPSATNAGQTGGGGAVVVSGSPPSSAESPSGPVMNGVCSNQELPASNRQNITNGSHLYSLPLQFPSMLPPAPAPPAIIAETVPEESDSPDNLVPIKQEPNRNQLSNIIGGAEDNCSVKTTSTYEVILDSPPLLAPQLTSLQQNISDDKVEESMFSREEWSPQQPVVLTSFGGGGGGGSGSSATGGEPELDSIVHLPPSKKSHPPSVPVRTSLSSSHSSTTNEASNYTVTTNITTTTISGTATNGKQTDDEPNLDLPSIPQDDELQNSKTEPAIAEAEDKTQEKEKEASPKSLDICQQTNENSASVDVSASAGVTTPTGTASKLPTAGRTSIPSPKIQRGSTPGRGSNAGMTGIPTPGTVAKKATIQQGHNGESEAIKLQQKTSSPSSSPPPPDFSRFQNKQIRVDSKTTITSVATVGDSIVRKSTSTEVATEIPVDSNSTGNGRPSGSSPMSGIQPPKQYRSTTTYTSTVKKSSSSASPQLPRPPVAPAESPVGVRKSSTTASSGIPRMKTAM